MISILPTAHLRDSLIVMLDWCNFVGGTWVLEQR